MNFRHIGFALGLCLLQAAPLSHALPEAVNVGPGGKVILAYKDKDGQIVIKRCPKYSIIYAKNRGELDALRKKQRKEIDARNKEIKGKLSSKSAPSEREKLRLLRMLDWIDQNSPTTKRINKIQKGVRKAKSDKEACKKTGIVIRRISLEELRVVINKIRGSKMLIKMLADGGDRENLKLLMEARDSRGHNAETKGIVSTSDMQLERERENIKEMLAKIEVFIGTFGEDKETKADKETLKTEAAEIDCELEKRTNLPMAFDETEKSINDLVKAMEYPNELKVFKDQSKIGYQILKILSIAVRVSTDANGGQHKFTPYASIAGFGEAYSDETALVWGDVVRGRDGEIRYNVSYKDAKAYCEKLNKNFKFDIRLPTKKEFINLGQLLGVKKGAEEMKYKKENYAKYSPKDKYGEEILPGLLSHPGIKFWSSSIDPDHYNNGYVFSGRDGGISLSSRSNTHALGAAVRCVASRRS